MVMSQAAIDALMSQNAGGDADDEEGDAVVDEQAAASAETATAEAPASPTAEAPAAEAAPSAEEAPAEPPAAEAPGQDALAGTLSPEERAVVEAAAAVEEVPDTAPTEGSDTVTDTPGDEGGVKMRRWSASATTDTDQLKERIQELEDKIAVIEATGLGEGSSASGADPQEVVELRAGLEQVTDSIQTLWRSLQELTDHSQGSLGFAAKQTFDCPECGSHGTVAVPVSCTNCGYESEWGFFPDE